MKSAAAAACLAVMLAAASGWAEPPSEARIAAIKAGAQIDKDCLKRNVIKEIGACRFAATGEQREPAAMLGLYFHMWFSDAVLAELYRTGNAELGTLFERLADAEFPPVAEYEAGLGMQPAELCRIVEVNCATALRYDEEWRARIGK